MSRCVLLIAVVLIGCSLVGCLGPADSTTASPTNTPTDSSTPSQTPASTPAPTTPIEYDIDVPECPERPESFTEDTVGEFATQFEQAYATRDYLRETSRDVVAIRVDTETPRVNRTSQGWFVNFTASTPAVEWTEPGSNETRHVDPALSTARYFISENSVYRVMNISAVDPRDDGERVYCPPRS
jgi:hypothetical protein